MSAAETLRIKSTHPASQGPCVVIDAADFDPDRHELYVDQEPAPAPAETAAKPEPEKAAEPVPEKAAEPVPKKAAQATAKKPAGTAKRVERA